MTSSAGLPADLIPLFDGFQADIVKLFDAFQYGNITLDQWHTAMRLSLSRHIAAAYMLGSGKGTLAETEFKRAADQLRKQLDFLAGFKDTINIEVANATAAGYTPKTWFDYEGAPWKAWKNRAEMYTGAIVEPYWAGTIGSLPLPAIPGDLSSSCGQNDRCSWRIVPVQGADMAKPEGADGDYDCYWVLDPSPKVEHCFPKGTTIETPSGKKPIELIRTGDIVTTMNGPKKVITVFKREYKGKLVTVKSGNKSVSCTPNHPFLTQRGWIRADELKPSDQSVLLESSDNFIFSNVFIPNTNDGVSTGGKIGVLGAIPGLLFRLPFGKWIESRVTMPVSAVNLNNKIFDFYIDNKFSLDHKIGLVPDSNLVKNRHELYFKFAWMSLLVFARRCAETLKSLPIFLGMIFPKLVHLIERFFVFHWVGFRHANPGGFINYSFCRLFADCKMQVVRFGPDFYRIKPKSFSDLFASICSVVRHKILNLGICPATMSFISYNSWFRRWARVSSWASTGWASIVNAMNHITPAFYAAPSNLCYVFLGIRIVSAQDRAVHMLAPSRMRDELFPAKVTNELRLDSVNHRYIIPNKHERVYVYNFEVEDVHHYIANGFVVHNCQQCIQRGIEWNPLKIRGWELVLPNYSYQVKERLESELIEALKGGKGSGNFGHSGRPGKHGGSAPQGESLGDKAKYARLEAGLKRRGEKLAAKFQDTLRSNPEYMQAQGRINEGRARIVEAGAKLEVFNAERRALDKERAAMVSRVDELSRNELTKRKEESALSAKMVEARIKHLAAPDDTRLKNKLDKLTTEHAAKLEEIKQAEAETREYKKTVSAPRAYAIMAREDEISNESKQALADFHTAKSDYEQIARTDGQKALTIAMRAADKLRQKVMSESVGGAIAKIKAEHQAELDSILPLLVTGPLLDTEKTRDKWAKLHDREIELKGRIQAANRLGDAMGESLFSQNEAGQARSDVDSAVIFKDKVNEGFDAFNRLAGHNPLMERSPIKVTYDNSDRAYFNGAGISVNSQVAPWHVTHELGHALESRDPAINVLATEFLRWRTEYQPVEKLRDLTGYPYRDDEVAIKDSFMSPYVGKIYGNRDHPAATEIVSMGIQYMMDSESRFYMSKRDPEYFNFTYALLHLGRIK
jgi:hypothetical protein